MTRVRQPAGVDRRHGPAAGCRRRVAPRAALRVRAALSRLSERPAVPAPGAAAIPEALLLVQALWAKIRGLGPMGARRERRRLTLNARASSLLTVPHGPSSLLQAEHPERVIAGNVGSAKAVVRADARRHCPSSPHIVGSGRPRRA